MYNITECIKALSKQKKYFNQMVNANLFYIKLVTFFLNYDIFMIQRFA